MFPLEVALPPSRHLLLPLAHGDSVGKWGREGKDWLSASRVMFFLFAEMPSLPLSGL